MPAQPRRALTGVPAHAQAAVTCSEAADRAVIVLLASNLGAAETLAEETAQLLTLLNAATPVARTLTEADAAVPAFEADCDLLGVLAALRHGGHDTRRPLLIACTRHRSRAAPPPGSRRPRRTRHPQGRPARPARLRSSARDRVRLRPRGALRAAGRICPARRDPRRLPAQRADAGPHRSFRRHGRIPATLRSRHATQRGRGRRARDLRAQRWDRHARRAPFFRHLRAAR